MRRKQSAGGVILAVILYAYLIAFAASIIFPLLWNIFVSFKSNVEFYADPWALPGSINLDNYIRGWNDASIGPFFMNSLYITVIVVALDAIFGSMTAYACTRMKLRIGNMTRLFYMMGMFVPTILCVVTIFMQMRSAKLLDTHLALIILGVILNMPFSVFVLSGNFATLPHELEEAAYIDGCSCNRTFWQVLLPLAKPGVATVSIFNFLGQWNEYVLARTIMQTRDKYTLPVGLVALQQTTNSRCDWTALFAGMVIVMIPTLIIYFLFQKYITSGMTAGAVKG